MPDRARRTAARAALLALLPAALVAQERAPVALTLGEAARLAARQSAAPQAA